jgi:UDP-glucose 4-epimerase
MIADAGSATQRSVAMNVLVTGGAGFIGSNLVDALVDRGDAVTVLDDLSAGNHDNLAGAIGSGAELVVADVADADAVREVFLHARPDSVFHLAAQVDVRKAVAEPAFDARVNVIGTINVLEAARELGSPGPANVVNISTGGAIYGERAELGVPADESARCAPETPYGQSKFAAEGYAQLYQRLHGVPSVSLRLANVYGPRQSPHGEAGVVAIFCGRLLAGEPPIVYGDGLQTRDYVYVTDVVEAMVAAERTLGSGDGRGRELGPYNVGTAQETNVLEIVERLARIGGREPWEPRIEPARTGEVQRISLECGLAERELGWRSTTDLETGFERTLGSLRT